MSDTLLIIPILIIVAAVVLLLVMQRKRANLQMPAGTPIYLDQQEARGTILYCHKHRLKGRPDFLLKDNHEIIPVEAKTGATPRQPYYGHIMQLIAYCVLVEATYGVRPPHGVIRYPGQQFEIAFTPEREAELGRILEDLRRKKQLADVHRNHTSGKRCASCGFGQECHERLDLQPSLPLDL